MSSPVLLYIDDSPDDIFLVQSACAIAQVHFGMNSARGGQAGWQYLLGEGPYADRALYPMPAVVLLDLKMPDIGGLELLENIRGEPRLKDLPVILFTASDDPADLARAEAAGVDYYVAKPPTLDELIVFVGILDRCLQHASLESEELRRLSRLPGPSRR